MDRLNAALLHLQRRYDVAEQFFVHRLHEQYDEAAAERHAKVAAVLKLAGAVKEDPHG